jgi:septal ring factor EnvC (AmiA/AmiB activator)
VSPRAVAAAGACAAILALPLPAGAEAGDLERLRRAIEDARARVASYEREERGLLEAVEALDVSLALLHGEVARAQRRAAEARRTLVAVEAEAEELAAALARTQRSMRVRAVALYKAGEAGSVRMLFAAGGVRDFLSRVQSLRLLLAHDADLLTRHRRQERALEAARERAALAAVASEEAAAGLRERQAHLDAERDRKRDLARQLGRSRARERSALAELETAARALEETLGALRGAGAAPPPPGPAFAALRGSLPAPVDAPLASGFGLVRDAEHRTQIFRKGLVFAAPFGEPVRAVAAGTVRYADWFRGYGRMLILDHGGDYYTVSGHLAEFRVGVGDAVGAGEAIGVVGDTGSLDGPRLYFEIRQGAAPLDPAEWLEALDAGSKGG